MGEEESGTDTSTPNPKQSSLCEECSLNPSKYKCPGCSIRSCSLPCVKAHKQRTGCTGKRPRTQFVPLTQFDDQLIISDYNLLEEVKSVAESAQRVRESLCGNPYFKLPFKLRNLRNAAGRRRTKLLFLPSGMSTREKNQSRYDYRKKSIFWTIEWRFHSTDVVLIDNGIHENTSLCTVIENHLKPGPWNHQLRPFCMEQLNCLKFFIRKYPKGSKSPFRELDIMAPVGQQLANLVILEYPVIQVFLPTHNYNFEVVKDAIPTPQKSEFKESVNNDLPSPKRVAFREEEIEEGCSDPQILDLMQFVNPDPSFQIPSGTLRQNRKMDNVISLSSDRSSLAKFPQGTNPLLNDELQVSIGNDETYCASKSKELGVSEEMFFDFEQDLRDAYSDLMAQANPDGFLDLEGGFAEEGEMEEGRDDKAGGVLSVEEELEEGEIPVF